jgi:hypothetical protein
MVPPLQSTAATPHVSLLKLKVSVHFFSISELACVISVWNTQREPQNLSMLLHS